MKRSLLVVMAAVCAVLAISTTVALRREHAAQTTVGQFALTISNDSAALDSTRTVSATNARLAHALGDSLQLVQRQVVQVAQHADAVDRALKVAKIGQYALTTRLDSLQRTTLANAPVAEDTGRVRRATWNVRQAPYTVAAAVEMPAPPDTASLTLRVALDPIPTVARLSCAPPNSAGIRTASIEATSPPWASIQFDHVEQSADLCASPALQRRVSRLQPAVIAGVGRIIEPDGTSRWGGMVGVGISYQLGAR